MEIRQFEAFAAVHASGSVTAAARLLDRSQPVVSRQLQDLENELGFTLFTRTRPQVTLTEQGREFLEEVRNVLSGLQQLEARSREIAEGRARPLRIATSLSVANGLLPAVLAEVFAARPEFQNKLYVEAMPYGQIISVLQEGSADVAFTSLPVELGRCQLHWCAQAPCQVAVPASHPLADEPMIRLAQLAEERVISQSNASRMRHRLSTALIAPALQKTQRQIVANSTMSSIMMVRAGLGVALVDPFLVQQVQPEGVVYKPFESYVPYTLGAVTQGGRPLSEEVSYLIEAVRDYAFRNVPLLTEGDSTGVPAWAQPLGAARADGENSESAEPTSGEG